MKSRLNILTVVLIAIIILICSASYLLYTPTFERELSIRQATKTQEMRLLAFENSTSTAWANSTSESQNATESFFAELTRSAPTMTTTFTITPTSSATPSPTTASTPIDCDVRVKTDDTYLYLAPSLGMADTDSTLDAGQTMDVIGSIDDQAWHKVYTGSETGWIRRDMVTLVDCLPSIYDLSYLLEFTTGEKTVIDDTFIGNENFWIDSQNVSVNPVRNPIGDQLLQLEARELRTISPSREGLDSIGNFKLVLAYNSIAKVSSESLVGVRFWVSEQDSYYEIGLTAGCDMLISKNGNIIFEQQLSPKTCLGQYQYWELELTSGNNLVATINGDSPFSIVLPVIQGQDNFGGIQLFAKQSDVQFEFLVITDPS